MDPEPISTLPPKKPIFLIILTALLFLSTAFLAFQNMKLQKQVTALNTVPTLTPSPTPVIATNHETGWQIFTNTRYGYSFEYPPDWTIRPSEDGYQISLVPNTFARNETLMWVRAGQTYYKDITDLSNNLGNCRPNSECITLYSKTKTTLDGADAVRYTRSQLGPGHVLQVDALKNGYVYSLILEKPEDSQENIKIFDQILSTFKFLDQNAPTSTCTPRPACLDATPRCMIPETEDMCPYSCPASGWVDCMPGPDAKPECAPGAMNWYKANCPNFQGGAL